ncbi:MAG TPA: VOC family protein [Bryobacteraceae bacterium]|nr:VOC family protein [Bryobacteraceae bacterium]
MLTTIERREGFTTVTPYVTVVEVERLIAFAKKAFGAVETERTTGSSGGTHCELRIGDSMLMCGGGAPARGREKRTALHIQVPDVDAVYAQALKAGGASASAPEDKPYDERVAEVKDPVGNIWYIATHAGPLEAGIRTVTPCLLRRKALELIEFLKKAFSAREAGIYKTPEGTLMHGAVWIGDALLEMGDADGEPSAFYLYVPDADALYQQALEAGAKSLSPPADQPYGDRMGASKTPGTIPGT